MKKAVLLLILSALIGFESCNKKEAYNSFADGPTALNFISKASIDNSFKASPGNYRYVYVCYKYNNSWYALPNNPKVSLTDVMILHVYSNKDKPVGQWIDYVQWQKDPAILSFQNTKQDSIPSAYQIKTVTKDGLMGL